MEKIKNMNDIEFHVRVPRGVSKEEVLKALTEEVERKMEFEFESEDERIRKEIIGYLNSKVATAEETEMLYINRWIAYLEKQKEQAFTHHEIDESLRDAVTHQMEDDGDVDDFVRKGIDDIALRYAILGAKWQKEQKDYNKLYEDIAKSEWFKKAYEGKSLGCDNEQGREEREYDKETSTQKAYREGQNAGRQEVFDNPGAYGLEKIDNVFGFRVGDKVRLVDGDGRPHIIKYFEKIEGLHSPDFYRAIFEDNTASAHIIPGDEYPNGYFTSMEKIEKQKEQKPAQKLINWTELTWKDIVELEGIINNVHYDFNAGIGQESFGKEVLERFRSLKGIEYLDESEQKYWREEGRNEQKPVARENDFVSKPQTSAEILRHYLVWAENSEEDCPYTWKTLADAIRDGIKALEEQKPVSTEDEKDFLEKKVRAFLRNYDNEFDDDAPYDIAEHFYQLGKYSQQPAEWSKEDKVMLNNIIWSVHMKAIKPIDEMDDRSKYEKYEDFLNSLPKRFNLQPKQEWGEEDEKYLNIAINIVASDLGEDCPTVSFLKSIRPKPTQGWSEKDEMYKEGIIGNLGFLEDRAESENLKCSLRERINWLKSIRPQPHWKPSKEQMEWLGSAVRLSTDKPHIHGIIISLYEQLKRL